MADFIKIEGWSNPRRVGRRSVDQKIVIEVMIGACRDCEPCSARKLEVMSRRTTLGLDDRATWELEGTILTLPIPEHGFGNSDERLRFLEHVLGRPVTWVEWKEVRKPPSMLGSVLAALS